MIGESVGNFVVIGRLGQGGMGEVLLAEHKDIKTKVAIKVLLPHVSADKQHVQRFFNEAVAVSKIKHAGIAKIFDVGFLPRGDAYLVMELLEGESLASRIQRAGRLPFEQVSDIAKQIASVLEATHVEGITHRDLKPDNIFLVPDAELSTGERVKVLDFGIAKLGSSAMTHTDGTMGTPTYMSPEQWKSSAKVDGRADVYSLGCLVFEMACGRPPYLGDSIGELCVQHLSDAIPSARALVPELPPAFDAFVTRLMAKAPEDRPSVREAKISFASFARDFAGVAAPTMAADAMPPVPGEYAVKRVDPVVASSQVSPGPAIAKPTTLGTGAMAVASPPSGRKRAGVIGAGIAALLVTGGVLWAVAHSEKAPASSDAGAPDAPPPRATGSAASATAPTTELAAPQTIRLQIDTVPKHAIVTIDGAAVANPLDGRFAKTGLRHRVDVTADGHKLDSRWITFDSDQALTITLDAEPVASKKPRTRTSTASPTPDRPRLPTTAQPSQPDGAAASPATDKTDPKKPTYKGTKGKIITEYPPD